MVVAHCRRSAGDVARQADSEGTGYLLAPANADPEMIGTLVATMLKDMQPFKRL